ncbi:hypothetical protein DPEC_G00164860 [Dallia pectoralis]|uniref:Uncharacterized protein n=1 Tax=Dallia pectoralis TaxID=75939 RepID=A0ACC2GH56_DALPE|nr:hypothetical protein DPEC_G00164860 [Dallia pectoralis]
MNWFGFGFNGFGQIQRQEKSTDGESTRNAKLTNPVPIEVWRNSQSAQSCQQNSDVTQIRASWSRIAVLHSNSPRRLCLAGFGVGTAAQRCCIESGSCQDADIGEGYMALSFLDRVEIWSSGKNKPEWSMEVKTTDNTGPCVAFPLVPGGYIASKFPFYRPLSPHLLAVSLALGTQHAVLLSATGDVYTWGSGSHGQLGHGNLSQEEEPRALEALMGLQMGSVAAGGWHSVCISAGGDLYVWGWNESGQLGLPSLARRGGQQTIQCAGSANTCTDQENGDDVFISIQAFPALMDVTESCEVSKVSCGSRHTAAVTRTGVLFTWGWGEYGQLGQGNVSSSDEPKQVPFFKDQGLRVVDVVCGPWNTFVSTVQEDTIS